MTSFRGHPPFGRPPLSRLRRRRGLWPLRPLSIYIFKRDFIQFRMSVVWGLLTVPHVRGYGNYLQFHMSGGMGITYSSTCQGVWGRLASPTGIQAIGPFFVAAAGRMRLAIPNKSDN